MQQLWTWGGKYFGYREGDALRTYRGHHIGYFVGDDAFGLDGHYSGEVKNDRLIVNTSKKNLRRGSVVRIVNNVALVKMVDYVGNVMLAGYEDFPSPEAFESS
jgi:hypothetical protein